MARFGDKRPHMNSTGMASVRVMVRLASPSALSRFCGLRHKWFRSVRLLTVVALVAFATTTGIGTSATAPAGGGTTRQSSCSVLQGHGISWPEASWVTCLPGAVAQSSPTVADWHGMTIIAVGDESGRLNVFDAATGEELPGWPEKLAAPSGACVAIEGSPTIAFLDGPNKPPSIIVGAASTWVNNTAREVEAFQLSGATRFIFHVHSSPREPPSASFPRPPSAASRQAGNRTSSSDPGTTTSTRSRPLEGFCLDSRSTTPTRSGRLRRSTGSPERSATASSSAATLMVGTVAEVAGSPITATSARRRRSFGSTARARPSGRVPRSG